MNNWTNLASAVRGEVVLSNRIALNSLVLASKEIEIILSIKPKKMTF